VDAGKKKNRKLGEFRSKKKGGFARGGKEKGAEKKKRGTD